MSKEKKQQHKRTEKITAELRQIPEHMVWDEHDMLVPAPK